MIAHDAAEAGPEDEATAVQIIQVSADHAEQPAEVPLRPGLVRMELDLRRFRFDQQTDLQAAFIVAGGLSEQIRVA